MAKGKVHLEELILANGEKIGIRYNLLKISVIKLEETKPEKP